MAASEDSMTAKQKHIEMQKERDIMLEPLERKRNELLEILSTRNADISPGDTLSIAKLSEVCMAISNFTTSPNLNAPRSIKQKRIFVNNWFQDNREKKRYFPDSYQVYCLKYDKDNVHFRIDKCKESEFYYIHAKLPHEFCFVGNRYLAVFGNGWIELEIVESGSSSTGEDKGKAKIKSVGSKDSINILRHCDGTFSHVKKN